MFRTTVFSVCVLLALQAGARAQVLRAVPPRDPPQPRFFVLPLQPPKTDRPGNYAAEYRYATEQLLAFYYKWEPVDSKLRDGIRPFEGELTNPDLRDAAITDLVKQIGDRWTVYFSPEEVKRYADYRRNDRIDLGAAVVRDPVDETFSVSLVRCNSTAAKIGLRRGDVLLAINGRAVKGLSQAVVNDLLFVKNGLRVDVQYRRGDQTKDVHEIVVSAPTNIASGKLLEGKIAYFQVSHFSSVELLPQFAREAARQFAEAGQQFNGIVLDLRGNPGGYMEIGFDFVSAFIEKGVIAKTTSRRGRLSGSQVLEVLPGLPVFMEDTERSVALVRALQKAPMVVLTDSSTMSCAEMVVNALKDNKRAVIVGDTTWGKAVSFVELQMPWGGVLQVTTGTFVSPLGFNHHGIGIEPNVRVTATSGRRDVVLARGLVELARLNEPPAPPGIAPAEKDNAAVYTILVLTVVLTPLVVSLWVIIALRRQRRSEQAYVARVPEFVYWHADGSDDDGQTAAGPEASDDCCPPGAPALGDPLWTEPQAPDQVTLLKHDNFFVGARCDGCNVKFRAGDELTERGAQIFCSSCAQAGPDCNS